jgi:phosphoribosylformylglycinamidine synthase
VLKQFQGARAEGPGDAAVIRPVPDSVRGLAIACGICPKYSDLDTYWMMAAAIDEAVRNLICVGARLGTIAGLDNFCWPDPVQSERTPDGRHKLAQLVRCCEALHEFCLAYRVPLISGKDSMKNDYKIGDTKISIPPTVLFTAVGIVPDVTKCVSMDAKRAGDVVYLLGETREEMGGSEYLLTKGQVGNTVPKVDAASAYRLYEMLSNAMDKGLVASAHDVSDGGLGAALAEVAIGGDRGMRVDLAPIGLGMAAVTLFSETQSRIVVTVPPAKTEPFEFLFSGQACYRIGQVRDDREFIVRMGTRLHVDTTVDELKAAWQRPLAW